MRGRALVATAAALCAASGITVAASARADGGTAAAFGTETWYEPQPTCGTAIGCLPVTPPAVNLYGAGTLHVAVSAGEETARAYLALKALALPAGATIASAPFVLPLDTSNAANLSPATAHVQVCASTGTLDPSEGTFADHPATDCSSFVPLTYVDGATPSLTGDLAPLLTADADALASGTLSLALLPDQPQPTDAWHLVFSSPTRTSAPTAPASLSIVIGAAEASPSAAGSSAPAPSRSKAAATSAASSPAAVVTQQQPPSVSLPAAPVTVPEPASAVPGPEVAPTAAPPATPQLRTLSRTIVRDYPYPALLLLPAALVLMAWWVVRIMTVDVSPRPHD